LLPVVKRDSVATDVEATKAPASKGDSHNIINLRNRKVEKVEEGCYAQALSFLPSLTYSTSRFKILRFLSPCGVSHFVKFMMLRQSEKIIPFSLLFVYYLLLQPTSLLP
jgi:hypothetical protein